MTPADLERTAEAIWGARWKTDAARALGVARMTVMRWADGRTPPPADLADRLTRWIEAEAGRLAGIGTEIRRR